VIVFFQLILFIVAIGIGFITTVLLPQGDDLDRFLIGAFFAFVLFSVAQFVNLAINSRHSRHVVDDIKAIIQIIDTRAVLKSQVIENIMSAFDMKDEIIRSALLDGIRDFSSSFNIKNDDQNSVEIKGERITLNTYKSFWQQLKEKQALISASGQSNMTVLVTHSTTVRVWTKPIATNLIELQKEFVKLHGSVIRILVKHEASRDSIHTYRSVTEKMRNAGIIVFVLELTDDEVLHYDFLIVPEFFYVFQWTSDVAGRDISGCEMFKGERRYQEYRGIWRNYVDIIKNRHAQGHFSGANDWMFDPCEEAAAILEEL
jgi:hypothetical protein